MLGPLAGKQPATTSPNHLNQSKTMGDKSPKANQKKSSQKQAKATTTSQAKQQQAAAAKQASLKK